MSLSRVIGGLAVAAFGVLMVIKSESFYQNFGVIDWAEQHMAGNGGSRMFYKLFGAGVALIGILVATNLLGELFLAPLAGLFVR